MASDYLLEIEGIKGDSADSKHKGTIEVQSFSWGASNMGSSGSGGGGGAGKVSIQDFHFTAPVSSASPNLFLRCADGKHIKKAVLFARKQGGEQHDYYKVTLEDLIVSSYQTGGHDGSGSIPTDQVSINAVRWKLEFAPQKPDGTVGTFVSGGWDISQNKAQ